MRTRTFIVLQLLACAYICSGQNKKTFGTDPASIICFKEVRINAGYAFGRKWSANADISINMENTSERWDEREAAHWLELYGKEQDSRDFKDDFIESCISFCYWPQSPFAGPVLTIGACVRDRSGPDMTVGAGYSCRIWKGLYAGFAYRIRVIESISKQHTPIEGIRISLDYVFETRDKDGREKFSQTYSSLTNHIPTKIHLCYLKALTKGIALTFLPAIHIGCSEDVLPSAGSSICTEVLKSAVSTPDKASTLDILIFEDDRLRRLDSYQRIEDFRQMEIYPSSTGGGKIFFFCMNSHRNRYDWADIGSYASLSGISCELEMEDRKNFVKTAEYRCEAGTDMHQVMMSTLVSEIDIENIMCDFYGTPYTDRKITDVRIYLTNVNANCPLIGTESGGEIRMINQGMLNHYDVRKFQDPSMIVQTIDEAIWKYGTSLRKSFVCYPHASNDGRGTRLVIEGKIDGETYFWPFEVGGPEGIEKNCRYIYRINIRRKGTTDPDCLIDPTDVELDLKVKPWSEKEEYCVMF